MKTAIIKAIEGGWKENWYFSHFNVEQNQEVAFGDNRNESEDNPCHYITVGEIILDPKFWQALGKSLGWEDRGRKSFGGMNLLNKNSWLYHWHRFIDAISEGQTPDQFFDELLVY